MRREHPDMSPPETANLTLRPSAPGPSATSILVVSGSTGTGKTESAVRLAERFNGELIGADSVQIYRGLDIGSAKPTPGELRGVPHHLIDVLEPTEAIDAAGFAALADRSIEEIAGRGKVPIVVGGTGLWLRALLRGLVEVPEVDPELRAKLECEAKQLGDKMHDRLRAVDPMAAAKIHPNDRLRIVRALEVFAQTGSSLGSLRAAHALGRPRYRSLCIALELDRALHRTRLERRLQEMLDLGWLDEVRCLRARYGDEIRPLRSVGYRQLQQHLREQTPFDEARKRVWKATWIYAKRQRTWLSNEPSVDLRLSAEDLRASEPLLQIERHLANASR
ncbi:MAG: tRNA (adenosine(37)-N6)-dimethylallyltransferase MiaA [Myxococcota bacterium]